MADVEREVGGRVGPRAGRRAAADLEPVAAGGRARRAVEASIDLEDERRVALVAALAEQPLDVERGGATGSRRGPSRWAARRVGEDPLQRLVLAAGLGA